MFLTNYLSLSVQLFGSDIDGFEQDYSALKNLDTLARALMPDGHYYHQRLVGIQELADQAGLKFI